MNTVFKNNPKKKWTWRNLNGGTSETEYILTDQKYPDSDAINRFSSGNDHRLVRCKVKFQVALGRQKLVSIQKKNLTTDPKS